MLTDKVRYEINHLIQASFSDLFSQFYQEYTNVVCNALNINQVRFEPWMLVIFECCHRMYANGYMYLPQYQTPERIALRRDALIVFQKRVVYGDVSAYDDFCIKLDVMEGV